MLATRDSDVLRAELRRVSTESRVPVLFGGEVHGDGLLLSEFIGTRTGLLRGLVVRSSSGLGGASMVAGRPMSVADYRNCGSITHDYDHPVLSEGIRSVLAVPVVVDGVPRAVLYGAYRTGAPVGGRAADLVVGSARRIADEMRIRDEVDRRLALRLVAQTPEHVREVHAELRRLAAAGAPVPSDAVRTLADRLAGADAPAEVGLSARELDVLTQVALGHTNAEAARRLSLKPETVKSYLRSASAKLGTRTRLEAVNRARGHGLLP